MARSLRALSFCLLALLAFPMAACDVSPVTLMIPDFDSAQVDGITFWRLDGATGQYAEEMSVVFTDVRVEGSQELVTYHFTTPAVGDTGVWAEGVLTRDAVDPDVVTVELHYLHPSPGVYKVSTYNAVGDSPMSANEVAL